MMALFAHWPLSSDAHEYLEYRYGTTQSKYHGPGTRELNIKLWRTPHIQCFIAQMVCSAHSYLSDQDEYLFNQQALREIT